MSEGLRLWVLSSIVMLGAGVPASGIAQASQQAQAPLTAVSLQQLLDREDYIEYDQAMEHFGDIHPTQAQGLYFFGMLAFHLGRLDYAIEPLAKAVNANDKSLTAHQIEAALETLGQAYLRLGRYGASADAYNEIDKLFGAQLGEGEQSIKDNRHLAVLLLKVPPATAEIYGDFTVVGTGREYPVSVGGKSFSALLDTGAEFTVLSESAAKAWGVTLLDGTGRLTGYSGKGFTAQPGYIPVLNIGKAELHNVAVYVTADENLYIPQIKQQMNALLGYPVVAALGRLTFAKDGSLTVSANSPDRDLKASAVLWFGGHVLLAELGTQVVTNDGKITGGAGPRLFVLDTGSGSTWLTDHYLAEHTNAFHGTPPEKAMLTGVGGGVQEIPAYAAHPVPLFAGDTLITLNGQHILTQPVGWEAEHFFGLIGQDVLGGYSAYTIDLRRMTLTLQP